MQYRDVVDFVRQRISAVLQHPRGWGPPRAVELQILLLVEVGLVGKGASKETVDGVLLRWSRHVGKVVCPGPQDLTGKLGISDSWVGPTSTFVEVVREFIESELDQLLKGR